MLSGLVPFVCHYFCGSLSVISAMPFLLYLKLIADEIIGFVIKGGTYQSL